MNRVKITILCSYITIFFLSGTHSARASDEITEARLLASSSEIANAIQEPTVTVGDFYLVPGNGLSVFSQNTRRTLITCLNQNGIRVLGKDLVSDAIANGRLVNNEHGYIIPQAAKYHIYGHYTVRGREVNLTVQTIATIKQEPILTSNISFDRSEVSGVKTSAIDNTPQVSPIKATEDELLPPEADAGNKNKEYIDQLLSGIPRDFITRLSTRNGRSVFFDGEKVEFSIGADESCYTIAAFFSYNGTVAIFDSPNGPGSGMLHPGIQRIVPDKTSARINAHAPFGTEIIVLIASNNKNELEKLAEQIGPKSTKGYKIGNRGTAQAAIDKLKRSLSLTMIEEDKPNKNDLNQTKTQWSWSMITVTTSAKSTD